MDRYPFIFLFLIYNEAYVWKQEQQNIAILKRIAIRWTEILNMAM